MTWKVVTEHICSKPARSELHTQPNGMVWECDDCGKHWINVLNLASNGVTWDARLVAYDTRKENQWWWSDRLLTKDQIEGESK